MGKLIIMWRWSGPLYSTAEMAAGSILVLIFGANWCPDCRILSAVLDLKTVNEYMKKNFEIMYIDLGRYDINMSLMEFFNIMPQQGIPRVVILNKEQNMLNIRDTGEWTTARSRTKQEIFNYFQKYKE